ncbi:Chorismate synthase [Streptomyces fumanus]
MAVDGVHKTEFARTSDESRSASARTCLGRRLDARLAAALMGIQAIKGVEVGDGFDLARVPGSQAHDEISPPPRASSGPPAESAAPRAV